MKLKTILEFVQHNTNSAFFYTPHFYNSKLNLKNVYSYLFSDIEDIIEINSINYKKQLKKIDRNISNGLYGYAIINYEAGFLFEKKLERYLNKQNKNLLMKFVFASPKRVEKIVSKKIIVEPYNLAEFSINDFHLNTKKNEFVSSIKKIKNFIEEGDTYQVNYTLKGHFNFNGSLNHFISCLLFNQTTQYSAIINNNSDLIISISPELFIDTDFKKITTRPMKGTIKRGISLQDDAFQMAELNGSEKDKAENLMIVDLMRNDLGRISKYNSVKVKCLFDIEKYESLYQMTSTITAELRKNSKLSSILSNVFPCGSITGAPKIRTMEIIKELEKENREVYTGSIGLISKDKTVLNVAIRTIDLNKKGIGKIGLGSGIVWDSKPENEYNEVLLKSNFLIKPEKYFEIFESMLIENNEIPLLENHLNRLEKTAGYFLFLYERKKILNKIKSETKKLDSSQYKLKLILNKTGKILLKILPVEKIKNEIKVIISDKKISSENKYQYFKTTNRELYEKEFNLYNNSGFFDVIFLNENGFVAEGAITNVFIRKENIFMTPPINAGILNGVYRKQLLTLNPQIVERNFSLKEILNSDEVFLTNAVRKIVSVDKLFFTDMNYVTFTKNEKKSLFSAT